MQSSFITRGGFWLSNIIQARIDFNREIDSSLDNMISIH